LGMMFFVWFELCLGGPFDLVWCASRISLLSSNKPCIPHSLPRAAHYLMCLQITALSYLVSLQLGCLVSQFLSSWLGSQLNRVLAVQFC